MPKTLDIPALADLFLWLDHAPELAQKELTVAMTRSVRLVESIVKPYPPATDSNKPGRVGKNGRAMGYYERGRGWWYPVMQAKTLGEVLGKAEGSISAPRKGSRVVGYKLSKCNTSQNLGRKWTVAVTSDSQSVEGVVGNTVDYAEYVQGKRQAAIHKLHDWKTLDDAVSEAEPAIMKEFENAADRIAENFSRE